MGEMGGILPLYFDGAVCYFKELPAPNDTKAMNAVYSTITKIRSVLFTILSKTIKKLKKDD